MDIKPYYKSKTIIFNTLTVLVVIATFFGYTPDTQLAENTTSTLLVLAPLVNIVLRYITKQPIA